MEKERAICRSHIKNDFELRIKASDIDASVLEMAKANAIAAGVADDIEFSCLNLTELKLTEPYGILITNLPMENGGEPMQKLIASTRPCGN